MRLAYFLIIITIFCTNCTSDKTSLFTLHDGVDLGIGFKNSLHEDLDYNIITYEYMYGGGGVAIEDFNGDQLADLYFTGTQEPDRLYINKGGLNFTDVTEESGIGLRGGFTTGVTVVDINSDGLQDIYVCKTGKDAPDERKNLLFVNQGEGKFQEMSESYGIGSDHHSNHALFFDYDNDSDLDLYVLNHPIDFENSQRYRIKVNEDGSYSRITEPKTEFDSDQLFRNDGEGKFIEVTEEAGILNYGYGLSISITDINNDGFHDLYIANDFLEPDIFYVNNGDGTFTNRIKEHFSHTSENSMGSVFSDMNNDGLEDFIALDMVAETNYRQKSLISTMTYERYQTMVEYGYMPQHMRNMFQLQNDDGSFSEIGLLSGISNTDWSWTPLTGDFDFDGFKDVFIANGFRRDLMDCDYALYQSDNLRKQKIKDISKYLEVIPTTPLQNYFFKNEGGITFEKVSDQWGSTKESFSNGAAMGDLDNDGDLDIIVNNINEAPFVYENNAAQRSENNFVKLTFNQSKKEGEAYIGSKIELVTGSKRQTRRIYPSMGYFSCSSSDQVFGIGTSNKVDSLIITWPDGIKTFQANLSAINQSIDIDRSSMKKIPTVQDNRIINKKYFSSDAEKTKLPIRKETAFDDFRIQALIPHKLSDRGAKIVTGDLDGDGLMEIIVGSSFDEEMICGTIKDGIFQKRPMASFEEDVKYEESDIALIDVNNDGNLDLYAVSGGFMREEGPAYYQDRIYLNDGEGNLSLAQGLLPEITKSGSCIVAMDYDDDGDKDIFVGTFGVPGSYPKTSSSLLLRNDNGKFSDVSNLIDNALLELGNITDAVWDQESKQLVVVGEWMGITGFKWNGTGFDGGTELLSNKSGWWNTISTADLNNDGLSDFIVGNHGLNSNYQVSEEKPVEIYADDFDGNGQLDPILTKYYDDVSFPMAQRGDLIKQLPYLQKVLSNYSIYARSTIEKVFPDYEKAMHRQVRCFETGVLLSSNGKYGFKALPIEAQFSPTFATLPLDINNDGYIDVLTGGNQIGANIESGPYDAGRLRGFLNDGKGNFSVIQQSALGIDAKGEVRDIVKLNNSVLVSQLNGPLEMYEMN